MLNRSGSSPLPLERDKSDCVFALQVLSQHYRDIVSARPQWVGYISTTGVYGDWGGAWIDEMCARAATTCTAALTSRRPRACALVALAPNMASALPRHDRAWRTCV